MGYLNILRTREVVKLFENTLIVLDENLRVNNSLFKNNKVTVDRVHRAKAEKSEIEHKLLEAQNNYSLAKSYFNYLLNKPLDDEVIEENFETNNLNISELSELELSATNNREEFLLIKKLIKISKDKGSAVQTSYYPGLSLAVDYGYQGEKFDFSSKNDYWMASLVFNWNIFNGFQDQAKSERAQIETKKSMLQLTELANKIRLQVREAFNNYTVSQKMVETARDQFSSSKQSFKLIQKKYKEGLSSQIEYLDSQNQLLQSSISKIIAEYNLLENFAKLEQVTANIDLVKYDNNQRGLE
jgi:outer membrane protein TolC